MEFDVLFPSIGFISHLDGDSANSKFGQPLEVLLFELVPPIQDELLEVPIRVLSI